MVPGLANTQVLASGKDLAVRGIHGILLTHRDGRRQSKAAVHCVGALFGSLGGITSRYLLLDH